MCIKLTQNSLKTCDTVTQNNDLRVLSKNALFSLAGIAFIQFDIVEDKMAISLKYFKLTGHQ